MSYTKIKMNYKLILPMLCLSGNLWAQQNSLHLSLDEAISYGLENNRAAKNASLDIEAAKKRKWETTTMGLPQINASIDYQNWIKQQVSLLPAKFFDPYSQIRNLDDYYDITQNPSNPIPNTLDGFLPLRFGTKQNIDANITIKQLLFDGSYLVGLESAKVYLEISQNTKQKTDIEVRKRIISAYANVLLVEESLQILTNNKNNVESNLNDSAKIFKNGLAEEESVEQLQITLLEINSNLRYSKRLKNIAYKMLNIILGIPIDKKIVLSERLYNLALKNIDTTLSNQDFNIHDNVDYRIAKNSKKSKELLLKLEKSKSLPTLSAFINGGYNGNNDEFKFLNGGQKWFGSSLFGVSINIPVFSSLGRTASTQRAKINYKKAKTDLTETEQKIQLELYSAKSDYQFAIEEYTTSKQNLDLAERIEHKNQIKYKEGLASSFELREAQMQLYSAQQNYLQTMVSVISSRANLESILKSNNIIN